MYMVFFNHLKKILDPKKKERKEKPIVDSNQNNLFLISPKQKKYY